MKAVHTPKLIYTCVLLALASQVVWANPVNPTVVNGQANFATTGNALTVTNTPGAIINWQGFSIGANEITRFNQQSAASAVLNRVVSSNPSSILGALQSNGRVFLINPNGIVFGAGATVDVAGLVASTLSLSNADFLAGNHHFTEGPGAAAISNAGNITAQTGGQIYLIAPNVANTGVITAPNGEILLAAGYSVDLVDTLNSALRVSITAPAGEATNVGQLIASAGSLGLFGTAVRNSGTVSADSATMQGGRIVFKASGNTTLAAGSSLSASGAQGGSITVQSGGTTQVSGAITATGSAGAGGTVSMLGNQVALTGAKIDASGATGGGTVLVGGNFHGAGPEQNASLTAVDFASSISADAISNGNGGNVAVWADNATQFAGFISARGGANSGNGGFVETSGRQALAFTGFVDTTAIKGNTGTLLLDPTDITISAAPAVQSSTLVNASGTFTDTVTSSTLLNTTLQAQLASSNVVVDTTSSAYGTGNIIVAAPIAWTTTNSLTLNAVNSGAITINAAMSGSAATVRLIAAGGGVTEGTSGTITAANLITSSVGGMTLTNTNILNSFNASNSGGGDIVLSNAAATLAVTGISQAGGGSVTVNNSGEITTSGAIISSGDVLLRARNGITQNADISAFGNVSLTANANEGMGSYVQSQGLTSNTGTVNPGNITINAYDIQVGAVSSRNNVLLNATHDIRILNAGYIGGGTAQNFHVDDSSFAYTLPFGFTYYGVPYSTLYVSSNGVITFGSGSSAYSSSTAGLQAGVQALPTISPAWSDWVTYAPSDIYIHQPSASTLAVRWDAANYGNNSYTANFETVLAQQGTVTFNYGAATAMSPGYSAIIGVSKGDNVHYTISALNNPGSLNNLASTSFSYNATTGNYIETVLGGGGSGGVAGSIDAVSDVTLNATGGMNIVNPITAATITAHSGNGITLGGALSAWSDTGNAIVLDAGVGNFINNAGSTALTASAGRWLVYSSDPALDAFGGLASGNLPLWGNTAAAYAPAAVVETGNRYLFSRTPVLAVSVTEGNLVKTYGTDLTSTTTTVSGLVNAATYGNVFTQEAYTGTAAASSAGFAAGAAVNGGTPYLVTVTGNIVAPTGYGATVYNNGSVTVNTALLSVTANAAGKTYDGLAYSGGNGVSYSGLVNEEGASVLGGALTYGGSSQGAINAGSYAITPGGLSSGNYTISYSNGALTVNPALLSVTANAAGKTYDGLAYSGGNGVVYSGLVNGETASVLGGALTYSGSSQGAINAGSYAITPGGLSSGNYTISYTGANLTVNPAILTVTASPTSRVYGVADSAFSGSVTGFVNGETLPAVTMGTEIFATNASTTSNIGSYVITGSGLTANNGNYTFVQAAGNTTALTITPSLVSRWASDAGGDWNLSGNWAGNFIPQAGAAVTIPALSGQTITQASGATAIKTLNTATTLTLSGGTFSLGSTLADTSVVSSGAALNLTGATFSLNGTLNASALNLTSGTLNGSGVLNVTGNFSQTLGTLANTLQSLSLNSTGDFNLMQSMAATQNISLNSGGAIINAAPAGTINLSAPTVQLAAATGIGSAATPLQLATTRLTATTTAGGGSLYNTPNGPVTLVSFTTNDASSLSYSQFGQPLTLTGIMSSNGGNLLIDPPTDLTLAASSSLSSGGGSIGLLASGNILLSSLNAGAGAVNIVTTGGSIGSSLPAGQNNITAGSVTASAVTGAQFSFNAPIFHITSTGGIISVFDLLNGTTIRNALPAAILVPPSVVNNVASMTTFGSMTEMPASGNTQMNLAAAVNLAFSMDAPGAGSNDPAAQNGQEAAIVVANAVTPTTDAAQTTPLPICH
jgi:filamentous hemagglutinin family protein